MFEDLPPEASVDPEEAPTQEAEKPEMTDTDVIETQPEQEPAVEAEEPVAEVEEPAAEEPVAEAEEPVAEEPAAEVEEPVAEEPAAEVEEPAAEEPAAEVEEPAAEEPAAEVEEPAAEEPAAEVEEPAAAVQEPAADEPAAEEPELVAAPAVDDPFGPPGDWYVIHTYAGYENKVKVNLRSRIESMQMQDKIFDVVVPMEDVMEIKGGRKQVVQKKVFPGYLLVKMEYDNDSWYVVRNTPGVTGFVASGTGQKPTPLSRREVEKILAVKKEETKPQFRLEFEEGDVVRIIAGPFADFNGTIHEINVDQQKVRVMVNIFDRETPVELSFDQITKV